MKKILGIAMLAAVMASCSSSDTLTEDNNSNAIKLSSKVSFLRSTYDTQLNNGSKVGFYVTEWADDVTPSQLTNSNLYDNVDLTADGNGSFTYGTSMFYPQSGKKVDFYAYHPRQAVNPTDVSAVPFAVQADQSVLDNYLASDLLWTSNKGIAKSHSIVPLLFQHKLAKLEFTVKQGNGVDLQNLSKIEVLGVAPETNLNLTDGSISLATGTPVDINVMGVTGTTEPTSSGGEAIIVPQTIIAGNKLIRVTLGDVTFTYTIPSDIEFESGKKYSYNITVNMSGIEVSSSIADWGNGGIVDGEGEMD